MYAKNKVVDLQKNKSKRNRKHRREPQRSDRSLSLQPYIRFRRAARAIKMLVNVCMACKAMMQGEVMKESWYAMADSILDGGNEPSVQRRRTRPFITFVPNQEGQLEQLSFDPAEYSRNSAAEHLLTDEILETLKTESAKRTMEQVNELLQALMRLSGDFGKFPLETQRQICKEVTYSKYQKNRVILKKGLLADGMHLLLSGEAVLKTDDRRPPQPIKVGEIFGMEELMCGSTRRITVITKSTTEILSLHRLDYQKIFNLAEDAANPKHLNICKNDIVFQHFPMNKLAENPGCWTVLAFKFGRLMVKDSNDTEWIYIIKSGEARVIKKMPTGHYDVKARREKVRLTLEADSPYHRSTKLLDFASDRPYLKSHYNPLEYYPAKIRHVHSAPPGYRHRNSLVLSPRSSNDSYSRAKSSRLREILQNRPSTVQNIKTAFRREHTIGEIPNCSTGTFDNPNAIAEETKRAFADVVGNRQIPAFETLRAKTCPNIKISTESLAESQDDDLTLPIIDNTDKEKHVKLLNVGQESATYLKTGSTCSRRPSRLPVENPEPDSSVLIPPFVQIETLHPGQVFWFRSCLPEEERGPSASLVSGGCEVLLVNKKFFLTQTDEALLSLIKLKYKPYPSEDELIDRLDANLQWQEYKNRTMSAQVRLLRKLKMSAR